MAIAPVKTDYSSYNDVVYRPCTRKEFDETVMNCMTIFATAVHDAAVKAAEEETDDM